MLWARFLQLQAVQCARVAGDASCQAASNVHGLPPKLLCTPGCCALGLRLSLGQQRSYLGNVGLQSRSSDTQLRS